MHKGYELFLTDSAFYDLPTSERGAERLYAIARRKLPEGWVSHRKDDWLMCMPIDHRLPSQGWKIHASACLDNADEIGATIWEYCIQRRIAFKFVPSRQLLLRRNMKYAARAYSGKFATIFPEDESQLNEILTELGGALDGYEGPYILSDLRWGNGPLYVRFGGFAVRFCLDTNGELVHAIEGTDGELVPDRRGVTFEVPAGVDFPTSFAPHLAARSSVTTNAMPYTIERALHFSNGGGVYMGIDLATNDQVVLKEARPHAGLSSDGRDAVERLRHEHEMLERLAGLGVVPAVRDNFAVGGHRFLVVDYVRGRSLHEHFNARYPLIRRHEASDLDAYTAWACSVCAEIERAVAVIHEHGIVVGDIHTMNVLVDDDDQIVIIDLESAAGVSEARVPDAAPAFAAPPGTTGFAVDEHALGCLRLFMFLPLTQLVIGEPGRIREMADAIATLFPAVPHEFLEGALGLIAAAPSRTRPNERKVPRIEPTPTSWARVRYSLAAAITASATPERDDRLFPGDPAQFDAGGLNLAHGAAGVLYALHVTGAGVDPDHVTWLVDRGYRCAEDPATRIGFWDGLHGVAYALDALGSSDSANGMLELCEQQQRPFEQLGLDLHSGLAGIGLNFAHFAARADDPALWRRARSIAEMVADRLGDSTSVPEVSGGAYPLAGLMRGSSGPALLFVRLYEHTRDDGLLDLAATALRQDLRRCVIREDGGLHVNEGRRTMPYLAEGSLGIGLVLEEFLAHRDDEWFAAAVEAIRVSASMSFYIEPGLFRGRAGFLLGLSRSHRTGEASEDPVIAQHIRRLNWHATTYAGELAFPGAELLRLSMDVATGSAGVLLALGAALHDERVALPFFPPATVAPGPLELATANAREEVTS